MWKWHLITTRNWRENDFWLPLEIDGTMTLDYTRNWWDNDSWLPLEIDGTMTLLPLEIDGTMTLDYH